MMVNVQLLGYLARYSPTGKEIFTQELGLEATIGRLLEKIGFPPDMEKMVLVNGHQSNEASRLADGDEYLFSPPRPGDNLFGPLRVPSGKPTTAPPLCGSTPLE